MHPLTDSGDFCALQRLAGYLTELVGSDCESVREFVLFNPFNELCAIASTGGEGTVGPNPWKRIASQSIPGHYYYFNIDTGACQWEPPEPAGADSEWTDIEDDDED